MTGSFMEARQYGIGELINARRYLHVPDHQRDYAWTEPEVDQLLDDIINALDTKAPDYFLGLIVLVDRTESGKWEILDGQQRLATCTMIYSAIRRWLNNNSFTTQANDIQRDFIGSHEYGEPSDTPRLTLNIANRKTFRELVVEESDDPALAKRKAQTGRHSSDRLLVGSAIACRNRVATLAATAGGTPAAQADSLFALVKYLRDHVRVVCLDVPSTANAYVIFESLNDRGADLSVLDLVKNHMFGGAGGDLAEVQSTWTRMMAQIGDRRADNFLKAFWTSRFGRVQRGRLFDEWRSRYKTKEDVISLASELAEAAEEYSALEIPDHDVWADFSRLTRQRVGTLALLGSKQVYPVMLAALHSFDGDRLERLLGHLITLILRYQVIGHERTGALEIACAKIAPRIFSAEVNALNTPQKVWNEFEEMVPDDESFRRDFEEYCETKPDRGRYLLSELEMAERQKRGISSELAPEDVELTLEHILPRNPSAAWEKELKDPDLKLSHRIRLGNLCLLREKLNKGVGSSGFVRKRDEVYASSDLLLTKELTEFKTWGSATIIRRQRRLAELAARTWPLPQRNY